MSYVSFDRFQLELLFKTVSDRSGRGSVIFTTIFRQAPGGMLSNWRLAYFLVGRHIPLSFRQTDCFFNASSYFLSMLLTRSFPR